MSIVGALPFLLQNGTTADATQVMADFNSIKNDTNTNAAANGANNDITSLSGLTTPLSVVQGGTGTATPANLLAGGYRNLVRRNGGMEIWQRGAGDASNIAIAASTTAYTVDGWYIKTAANQASHVGAAAGIANGSQFAAVVQRDGGQTGTGGMTFGFPLDTDEIYPMLGQFVRLSLTLKAGANWSPASGNITIALNVGTGTPVKFTVGYTGATVAATLTQALTTTATRYQLNTAAIIPTTTRQAEITLTWTPVGTAGSVDAFVIDDVQLEIVPAATGYVASNFERLIFEEQLLLCQRHFFKAFPYATAPASNTGVFAGAFSFPQCVGASTTQAGMELRFPVGLRASPTYTLYNPSAANAQARNSTTGTDCSSTQASSPVDRDKTYIQTTSPGGSAAGNFIFVNLTADAGI